MNTKAEITYEEYCTALNNSWQVEMNENNWFPRDATTWVKKKCCELGSPFPYVAMPLISCVTYSLGKSVVQVSKRWKEPVIIYSLVSGRSGTNKTGSLFTIEDVMESLVKNDERQHVFNTGTMEGLMSTLQENNGSVLCAVDEFSTFLDNLDKNSNGNAERSRYLSLWSGATWSKKTKNGGLVQIKDPRFNFTGFNQNFFLINLILKGNNYDGFLTRFLVATPQEIFTKLGDKIAAGDEDDTVDMQLIMNIIYNKFKTGCTFKLSKEALRRLSDYHDDDVIVQRMNDKYDDLKGSLLSKSISNVLRVAAVQCALRYEAEKAMNITDDDVFPPTNDEFTDLTEMTTCHLLSTS